MVRTLFKTFLVALLLLVLAAAGIHRSGRTREVLGQLLKPRHGFDLAHKAPRLDYADPASWLALPDRQDRADLVPIGVEDGGVQGGGPVDVFFVHPTTYLHREDWNDPLAPGTATEENTQWVLANQASAYNGCCKVHAPRYRQTSIFRAYADAETRRQATELAYGDVEAAFDYFLAHMSRGRPFVLAGHSQGTRHARRLLARRISGTPLAKRMVAAFLPGSDLVHEELDAMPDIHACAHETDLHCVVHWATFGEGGAAPRPLAGGTRREGDHVLCTNPLSWKIDEARADRSLARGAVLPSGRFNIQFWRSDRARGIAFEPLSAPIPEHTWAQCRNGNLIVEAQIDNGFSAYGLGRDRNYHGLDYALFYMDIRENAKRRVAAYLARGDPAVVEAGYVAALAAEHAGDAPHASPAARSAVKAPIVESAVVYASVGGEEVRGFLARPEETEGAAAILLIHEWWGLNDNIRAMARRLAAEGYVALAVDLYGGAVATEPEAARELMGTAMANPRAALENLRQAHRYLESEHGARRTGSIGWCFGGGWSLQAALLLRGELDAAVMYYGRVETDRDRLALLETPLLGLFAGQDRAVSVESVRAFEKTLSELGKPAQIHVYEGADHAFANPSGTRYQPEAAQDAWRRTVAFFRETLLAPDREEATP
jgi:carboxymethylenebutenolidase